MKTGKLKKAFTIVEVMIIIAVLAMLCAFLIPLLLTPRISANEAKARLVLKQSDQALKKYRSENNVFVYPDDILGFINEIESEINTQGIVPGSLTFEHSGYWFVYLPGESDSGGLRKSYDLYAVPIETNISGINSYVINEKGIICLDSGGQTAHVDQKDAPVL
jgi:Tfp pilus assembly protein PilE